MVDDLGGRLTRAGLVTRSDLADIVASAPPHDAALVRALVRRGVAEDALAGFFLSEGFGPLLEPTDLDRAEPAWARRLPSAMALDFLALPLRAATDGVVVAMAAPSDAHIVRELGRVLGARVLATVARVSHIERRLRGLHPDAVAHDADRRPASEPPVLELTRRRTTARGFDAGFRAPDGTKEAKLGPRLALPDDEPAMPLVRQKPSAPTPAMGTPQAPRREGAVMRTFARPDSGGTWGRGSEKRSNTAPLIPAIAPLPPTADEMQAKAAMLAGPPASNLENALTDLARRASEPSMRAVSATQPALAATPPATASGAPSTPPIAAPPVATQPPPVMTQPPAPPAIVATQPPPVMTQPPAAPSVPPAAPSLPPAPASIPPGADERWDLPSPPSAPPAPRPTRDAANKLSPRATADLPTIKAAPTDIGTTLASMRSATDRDEVVRLACEGATSVARAAVFFALRKGVLKGWDGAGPGVRRDSVRNLWIPTSSESTFKRVLESKNGSVGPYGTSVADGLFRAAVGSRGGDLMVQPVVVAGKVVGMLCVDDLRPGPLGAHRVEVLAQTVGDAFMRIISAGKE